MITRIQLKKIITSARVFGIVKSKFSHWKKSNPIVLFKVDKDIRIFLYDTILTLGLAISFGVKCGRKFVFDLEERTEGWPKLQDE